MTKGRLAAGPFAFCAPIIVKKYFREPRNFCHGSVIMVPPGRWITNMRILVAMLIVSAVALPCSGQTILKSEPLVLAPYEVAYVQDMSCPIGKVLKVTGAIRGLHRKRECVALSGDQASLAVAVP
jgi:hypothetical protein